jgi:LCP family protein required for cell wall assembly
MRPVERKSFLDQVRQWRAGPMVAGCALVLVAAGLVAGRADAQQATPSPTPAPSVVVARTATGSAGPDFSKRITLLVIGSDSGAPKFGRGGTVAGGRADSIHLVVIDPNTGRGTMIGFPRDSYLPIPGHGTNKLNAAMVYGGPSLLVRTIEQYGGISIDYYVLTSFDGLTDLVNGVGGIRARVPRAVVDPVAGAKLRPGLQRLSGTQALALSRARKSLPGGDFTRSEHQGVVLLGGLGTFQAQLRSNPAAMIKWLAVIRREVATDLSFSELFRLGLLARSLKTGGLRNRVLPGVAGEGGGASVVRLSPQARSIVHNAGQGRF